MDYVRDFLRVIGRGGICLSFPGSGFTAVYATAETLTLGGAGIPTITDASQILGVIEWPAGQARPRIHWATDYATSYAAPTLTMDGADFAAGSKFSVIVAVPGAQGVFLSQGFDYTLCSTKTYEVPGFTITRGTRDCTVANTAYPLAATSTPCFICFIWAREANAGTCIWGDPGITTVGAPLPKPSVAILMPIPISNVNLLNGASSGAGDDIDWLCIART